MNTIAERIGQLSGDKRELLEQVLSKKGVDVSRAMIVPRKAGSDTAPLSFAQHRLWFLDQLEPGSAAYNMGLAYKLEGALDVGALEGTLNEIIRRHEVLRTSFVEVDGQPLQLISSYAPAPLPFIDLSSLPADARQAEARARCASDSQRPFSLPEGGLLRPLLVKFDEEEHVLSVVFHHIVSDGWSISVFSRELGVLYRAFSRGLPSPLEELPVQYADYAAWQRRRLSGAYLAVQLAYWRDRLAGAPPLLELPTDYPRPAVQSFRGASVGVSFTAEETELIRRACREQSLTPFMALLAAFYLLLSRYSGQGDVSVGTPVAGRGRLETEGLIGFFVNTLVLRVRVEEGVSVRELWAEVREAALEADAHQEVPFEKLVEELEPERSLSYGPLFQVMFAMQNTLKQEAIQLGRLKVSSLNGETITAKFDLTLEIEESGDAINGNLTYNTDLFSRKSAERIREHYQRLVLKTAKNPEQQLGRVQMLSTAEREQSLRGWNDTGRDYERDVCVHELIERQAAATPGHTALVFEGESLTYAQLNGSANRLAHHLRRLGVGPEATVGVLFERSPEMVVALLAVLKAGGAYLPLDPAYPVERLAGMLTDAGVRLVLTAGTAAASMPEGGARLVRLDADREEIGRASDDNPPRLATPENLAYVIYTSGSTGRPKGAMNTHAGIVNRLLWMQEQYGLDTSDAVLQKTPFTFDVSVWEFFWPLLAGARLVVARPDGHRDPNYLTQLIRRERVTTLHFVPPMLQAFLGEPEAGGCADVLRRVICSGEALGWGLQQQFFEVVRGVELHNLYGPTEAAVDVTYWPCVEGDESGVVPIGRPVANTQIYVLDGRMNPVPARVSGELYIGGVQVGRGYLSRPALTAERFIPDPYSTEPGARLYRTGDVVRRLPGGEIEYLGRTDQQVKLRGFRIELGEIESVLGSLTGVSECAVIVREEGEDKRLAGYVVLDEEGARQGLTTQWLREQLKEQLPEHMVPAHLIVIERMPLTPNGKLDRKALPAPSGSESAAEYVAPRSVTEQLLAGIWREVLRVERVGVYDNFFELGGHSLLATQVIARVRAALRVELALRALFEQPQVAGLARRVEQERASGTGGGGEQESAVIEAGERGAALELSYAQQRLWFLDQLAPGGGAYNLPVAVRLGGALNVGALEGAIGEIVRRHEVLRTNFVEVDGRPVQVIAPESRLTLPVVDLGGVGEEREDVAREILSAESGRGFSLSEEALLRPLLVRLSEEEHVLSVVFHHIVSDGWSISVFGRELTALYTALVNGRPSPLEELPVQYADYAAWQRRRLAGAHLEVQLAYWRDRLAGAPPLLELPTDYPRPAVQSFRGASVDINFTAAESESIRRVCREQSLTPFMALLAAFYLLLSRYSGQGDVSVGTPVAGRTRLETEDLIGFFVNTLVLRVRVDEGVSVRELWAEVREAALEADAHQEVPFEKLVEELEPERSLSYSPLFQVMFVMQNVPEAGAELEGLRVSGVGTESGAAKFDLTLGMEERGGAFSGSLSYSTDLFTRETAERMAGQFVRLAVGMAEDGDRQLGRVEMLSAEEREQVLRGWNQTAREYERGVCVHELFERQAELTPWAEAVVSGEERVTYGELNERANRVAHLLRERGVGVDGLVAVLMERGVWMVAGLLGVLKAGGGYVPLDTAYPAARLGLMLEDAAPAVILTQESAAASLPEWAREGAVYVDRDRESIAGRPAMNLDNVAGEQTLAYVIYTSGSTGTPKGVAITHGALLNLVHWHNQRFELAPAEHTSHMAGTAFDASVLELWPALAAGACLYLPDEETRLTPLRLLDWLTRQQVSAAFIPTPVAEILLSAAWPAESPLKRLMTGGDQLHQYRSPSHGFELINNYGPTETTVIATYSEVPVRDERAKNGSLPSIGRPIANTTAYVLDARMQPLPVRVSGELYLGGAGLARGYLGRPALTAERFIPDPYSTEPGARLYRTGDLCRWQSGGELEYLGRTDQQVKLRGFRIELGEIESVLGSLAGVSECAVVLAGAGDDKRLVAYLVPEGEGAPTPQQLREQLRERLPEHMIPSHLVVLERMPLTPNGKLDRKALPAPSGSESAAGYVAPRSVTEQLLAGIWREVLRVERVGVYDNFFELGGHSLLATQVIARVRAALRVELALRALFEQPQVAGLARRVEAERRLGTGEEGLAVMEAGERDAELPLSYAQQRLWFLEQLEPGNATYNIPVAVRLGGALNVGALEGAIGEIVRRHEVLRTNFVEVDGRPLQVIAPESRFTLPVVDLGGVGEGEREEQCLRELRRQSSEPFDLAGGTLLRAMLIRLGEEEHVLSVVFHHIVSDGWSMSIFSREFAALYLAFCHGLPSPLEELPVQYADYAAWQRRRLAGAYLAGQLSYWRERLSGAPPLLELPTDYPRPAVQSFRGSSVGVSFTAEESESIRRVCREQSLTPFMALLSAYALMLSRYSGQGDICVGTPVAGRTRLETEDLIGFFVNTLVLRVQVDEGVSVRELWAEVREAALEADAHQEVPFEKLVEELEPERSLSYSPLFQVMFVMQNTPEAGAELEGLRVSGVGTESEAAKFDLTLGMEERGGELRGGLTYNTDLFTRETAERMAGQFVRLAVGMAEDGDRQLGRVEMLSAEERELLLAGWNQTAKEYEPTARVNDMVERQAASAPDAVAVVAGGERVTYGELNERANRVAHYLCRHGVETESRVAVLLSRGVEAVVAMLGVLKAGGAYVPLDPEYPRDRLVFMLEDAGAKVLLTNEGLAEAFRGDGVRVVCLDAELEAFAAESAENFEGPATPENLAYVIYTSGSTGTPKGVMVTHRAICNHLQWRQSAFPLRREDVFLHKASLSFDISVWEVFGTLAAGARLVIARPGGQREPDYLVSLIAEQKVTFAHFGPAQLQATLEEPGIEQCQSLARIFCGGEALSPDLYRRFKSRLRAEVVHQYGPTETTVDVTAFVCTAEWDDRPIPIGRPVANTRVFLLDARLQPVPVGVAGELYVAGESLARGYLGRPALTAERFIPDPYSTEPGARLYRTGDLCRWQSGGELEYLGRTDQQVKLRGFRIELGEIESVLGSLPGVSECAVIVREEGGDKRLVAYLVLDEEAPTPQQLREQLRERLPEHMVPAQVVTLERMPLTPNGKLDRKALPAPGLQSADIGAEYVAPRSVTEQLLAGIWREVLRVERVGVYDNFFELGGHSLLATQVIARVRAALRVELALRALFEQPQVAGLARRVEQERARGLSGGGEEGLAVMEAAERGGALELSHAQQRLWFLDQLAPGGGAYNLPVAVRLGGALNVAALEGAIGEIVRRHEVLRTNFVEVDGRPLQVIAPASRFTLPVVDLGGVGEGEREGQCLGELRRQSSEPFDLAGGTLLRAMLIRLGEEEHVLSVVFHHIVSDGWSISVFSRELTALYTALMNGRPSPLEELPVQYADYAAWQRRRLSGAYLAGQLSYWRERLSGAPPLLELPTDYPRPAVQSFRGASVDISFTAEETELIRRACREQSLTPFMALLAAFYLLLSRYSRQSDICIGTPVAGRTRLETEGLIGFFVNTLVLRVQVEEGVSVRELWAEVREAALEADAHQEVPFEKLVEELEPERSLSYGPLFQAMFVMQNTPEAGAELDGLRVSGVGTESGAAKFDLTLGMEERGGELRGGLTYNTDLFTRETAERMAGQFVRLVTGMCADGGQQLGRVEMLSAEEREQVVRGWNQTAREYERGVCVHELFERQAAERPEAEAVVCGEGRVTYGELNERANRIAHYLREQGVGPERLVAVLMERGPLMVAGLLGVLKAGGAYLPLDASYPAARLGLMLEDAGPAAILTQLSLAESLPVNDPRVVCLDRDWEEISRRSGESPEKVACEANLAYVIYTSGSTGRPKGVAVTHGGLLNLVRWHHERFGPAPAEHTSHLAGTAFDASALELWPSLTAGACLHLPDEETRVTPALLLDWLAREQVSSAFIPTPVAEILLSAEWPDGVALRRLMTGGDQLHQYRSPAHGFELINNYGPTESSVVATSGEVPVKDEGARGGALPSIGRPIANTTTYVLDGSMGPVPAGVPGELYLGGAGLARGYLRRPALTAERFIPDPYSTEPGARLYRTGDLCRWRAGGELEYLGRTDQQVKVRGFRIELGEIESVLGSLAGVTECAVLARDESGEKRLVAYLVLDEEAPTTQQLRERLRERLPEHMIPSHLVVLERMPLTPNGKLDRKALPAPSGSESAAEYVAPRSVTEQLLAGIWREVLGVERVGVYDNFFELGGHSLLATQVIARVRAALRVELALRALFEQPQVAGLARRVEQERARGLSGGGEEGLAVMEAAERGGALELSHAQQRLWFLDQLEPGNATYNIPVAVRLGGALNIAALEGAIGEIVRRHEVLRTNFVEVDGRPLQVIAPASRFTLPVVDLGGVGEEREDVAREILSAESGRGFSLSEEALLRPLLVRLGEEEHVLSVVFHHIVSDGWSISVFSRELTALYTALVNGRPSPLEELPVQYADYAQWQRRRLAGAHLEVQLAYWRDRLAGAPPLLELPTDYPRPAVQSFRGASVGVSFTAEESESIRRVCREQSLTPFMALLAAFYLLLSRYSGQGDVSVGTPVAGRGRLETEGLIGFFVNTLVLRVQVDEGVSVRELWAEVREAALEADAHQEVPFEKLVEELEPERSLSYSPLFQVMFVMQNVPEAGAELEGLRVSGVGTESGAAKFDLTLGMEERGGELRGGLTYNTDLFTRETAERMAGQFVRLAVGMAEGGDRQLGRVEMLSAEEREQVVRGWNQTAREYERDVCVHELFERQAAERPEAEAVVCGEGRVSYGELNERANRIAHYLREQGVGPERLVAVLMERGPLMVAGLLGVLKAGGGYVPLDTAYPAARLGLMLEDAAPAVILTQESAAASLPEWAREGAVYVDRDWEEISRRSGENPERMACEANVAYVIYTSGSTGRPKGVAITHRSAAAFIHWSLDSFSPDEMETVLASTSICFDLSVFELFATLSCGGRVLLAENALQLPVLPAADEVTMINTVPSAMRELVGGGWVPSSVRTVNLAGEALSRSLVESVYQAGGVRRVWNLYGPTEDTTYSTASLVCAGVDERPLIGRPIANTTAYVLDARMQPLPAGVPGELYLGGAGLARGYLGRLALTAEKFVPDPFSAEAGARLYRTGDLCRWRTGGELEYLGRTDQQVKVRGFRIELGEVESVLGSLAGVSECAVIVREEGGHKRLVGYVVLDEEAARQGLTTQSLREQLKVQLPEHMVPAHLVILEGMPLTPNGKLDRKALPAPSGRAEVGAEYVAPRTLTEQLLAGIWQEVLGVERVGVYDNFFELGGHSLLATQVIARVRAALRVELALRALFEQPQVAGLARLVEAQNARGLSGEVEESIGAVGRGEELELSYAQQRLWFLDQLEPGNATYNIPVAVRLSGSLQVWALEGAIGEIVRRHEVLRTNFVEVDGRPLQVIAPESRLTLPVVDLGGVGEEREDVAREILSAESGRGFSLSEEALLRPLLVRLSEEEHVLSVVFHHIVSDGWSVSVFSRELTALYTALMNGRPSPLEELPVQYADYAAWQRRRLSGAYLAGQLSYWRERLSGAPPLLELPTDYPRPAVQSFRGASVEISFTAAESESIRRVCREQSLTPFMALLAAFYLLLSRYSGQGDICVGTPVAGRGRLETEGLIGFFVNTLVLRVQVDEGVSVRELWAEVREAALEADAHQEVPFEKLVEELEPERSLSYGPLFQVMFVMQNTPEGGAELDGLRVSGVGTESGAAKFDLTLGMEERGGELRGGLTYNTDLFTRETAERMAGQFVRLVRGMCADGGQQLGRVEMLSAEERELLLVGWNQTKNDYSHDRCLHQIIEEQSALTPGRAAVVYEDVELSYAELNERANQLARRLRASGVGPDSLVGVMLERGAELVVALLGVLKAGGAYLPLDPYYPPERIRFMLEDSCAGVLLTQRHLAAGLPEVRAQVVALDAEWPESSRQDVEDLPCVTQTENLAYVIYTSGSTGKPKGVQISHRALVNFLTSMARRPGLSGSDVLLSVTSLSFDIAGLELFLPLTVGGRVALASRVEAADGLRLMQRLAASGATVMQATPATWRLLLDAGWGGDACLTALCGGEAMAPTLAAELAARTRALWNMYGPTETTIWSAVSEVAPGGAEVTIGGGIANTQLYVLDAMTEPVPVGVSGELYIGGDGLARGYLNRPALTAEKFVPDPHADEAGARMYRTGDLVRLLADGRIRFLGRIDHQVKVRGYRIELGEIETALSAHGSVGECVVVAREDAGDKRLVAYLVGAPDETQAATAGELREHLRQRLPEYMVPSAFVMLDALPLTPNGKVDRKALPAPGLQRTEAEVTYVAPRDGVEFRLARIWERVLGAEPVGMKDNFFELGGHSLLAVRLMAGVEKEFGRRLPLMTLFSGATVEHMAGVLRREVTQTAEASLVALQPSGDKAPLFFVHPVGGQVFCYTSLSHHLGQEQPFYGFQIQTNGEGLPVHTNIEAMAGHYLQELRGVQPEGPYFLGGWSMGGAVALAMAQRLRASGQEVRMLALVDSMLGASGEGKVKKWVAAKLPARLKVSARKSEEASFLSAFARDLGVPLEQLALTPEELRQIAPERQLGYVLEKGREAGVLPGDVELPAVQRLYDIFKNNYRALKDYAPGRYDGRAVLFKTEERPGGDEHDPTMGWGAVVADLELQSVPGNHYTIVREPHVRLLAERLRDYCQPRERK